MLRNSAGASILGSKVSMCVGPQPSGSAMRLPEKRNRRGKEASPFPGGLGHRAANAGASTLLLFVILLLQQALEVHPHQGTAVGGPAGRMHLTEQLRIEPTRIH